MQKITSFCVALALSIFSISITGVAYAGVLVDFEFPDNILDFDIFDEFSNNDESTTYSVEDFFEAYGEDVDFNWFFLVKWYENTDPIDIPFLVENSDGTTEYLFVELLINGSDTIWTDYHVELIYDDEISFDGNLDFDIEGTPPPSSFFFDGDSFFDIFTEISHADDSISWSGGEIPPWDGEDIAFLTFSMDVPDIDDDEEYEFILRQYPTVIPEPATLSLLSLGMLGFGFARRKKRGTR